MTEEKRAEDFRREWNMVHREPIVTLKKEWVDELISCAEQLEKKKTDLMYKLFDKQTKILKDIEIKDKLKRELEQVKKERDDLWLLQGSEYAVLTPPWAEREETPDCAQCDHDGGLYCKDCQAQSSKIREG